MRLLSAMTFGLVLGLAQPAPAGEFAFESLSQVIAEQHVGSVEELIAALPEDLRAHYSLIFSSRSLQDQQFFAWDPTRSFLASISPSRWSINSSNDGCQV